MPLKSIDELNTDFIAEYNRAAPEQTQRHPAAEEAAPKADLADRAVAATGAVTPAAAPDPTPDAKHKPITPLVIDPALIAACNIAQKENRSNGDAGKPGPEDGAVQESRKQKKSIGALALISDVIFYLAIALILVTILTSGTQPGAPKTIFGFSYFTVESRSMQSEIPKGSFILVKKTQAEDLGIGDTITFMRGGIQTVTHNIVEVLENQGPAGGRGFRTMGVNNASPDEEIVLAESIVGKVIFTLPVAGAVMSYLAENVYIVLIIFGLCLILSFCIRGLFVKPAKKGLQGGGVERLLR
ncbi:MAG: signal peptidase I [Oscillospiraceae bacterium]|nr:signal peptidase I [Oscillospiraceae bacterium]